MSKLLLLDDDLSLFDGLAYSLRREGFEREIARSISEALDWLSKLSRFDLLILDVTLPDGTDFSVCEQVRKQGSTVPLIFLTASDEEASMLLLAVSLALCWG